MTEFSSDDNIIKPFNTDHTILVTFFANMQALGQLPKAMTLSQLAGVISLSTAPRKFSLPWLKLARFGSKATAEHKCLRNNTNVQTISGIEAEHDAGTITFETAVTTMLKARIRCLIYTSPSWQEGVKEKWRILLPTSKELPPDRRYQLVTRVNGDDLFQGEISNESFVLSQAYLFGHLHGADHHEVVIDGDFIDLRRDLDAGALGKLTLTKGSKYIKASNGSANYVSPCRSDAEIMELLPNSVLLSPRGEKQWHNVMLSATASMIGRGWSDEQIYDATAEFCDAGWGDPDIQVMVEGGRKKWGVPDPDDMAGLGDKLREILAAAEAQQAAAEAHEEAELGRALDIWEQCRPLRRTAAMRYLRNCGIDALRGTPLEYLQFHDACPWQGGTAPALVALVVDDVSGHPVGIQITALAEDGRKLGCEVIGTTSGGVIALSAAAHVKDELAIAVGIESALSARACGIEIPIWAVLDLEGLAKFPVLPCLPIATAVAPELAGIRLLTVIVGNDKDAARDQAIAQVRAQWEACKLKVRLCRPQQPGWDFNDLLKAGRG